MSDQETEVKQEEFDTIYLHEEEETQNFTIVPNALIRNNQLSPNCRWLIIFLLSNKKDWNIKTKQICEHTKGFIGRDGVRKCINEAIEAGYMRRKIILRKTPRGNLRGCCYTICSKPVFKKCLRQPGFQGPEDQGPEDQGPVDQGAKEILSLDSISNEILSKEITSKETPPTPKGDDSIESCVRSKKSLIEISQEAKDLYALFIKTIQEFKPNFAVPKNPRPITESIQKMLEEDKRKPDEIIRVLEWGINDNLIRGDWNGWSSKILGAKNPASYLRLKFEGIELASKAKKERKFSPCSNDDKAYEKMKEMSARAI